MKDILPSTALKDSNRTIAITILTVFILLSTIFSGCAPIPLNIEEAKQTDITMRGQKYVPPPRSIDDILIVIGKESRKDPSISKKKVDKSKEEPPAEASKIDLANFYFNRGEAAFVIGKMDQGLYDLRKAYEIAKTEPIGEDLFRYIAFRLAAFEKDAGNLHRSVELLSDCIELPSNPNDTTLAAYHQLLILYATLGDFTEAKRMRDQGLEYAKLFGKTDAPWVNFQKACLEFRYLGIQGKHKEAEPFHHEAVKQILRVSEERPDMVVWYKLEVAGNLRNQGRLLEAELWARECIRDSIKLSGVESGHTADSLAFLAGVLLKQGRINSAEKIMRAAIGILNRIGMPSDYFLSRYCKSALGGILVADGRYEEAMDQYDYFRRLKDHDSIAYELYYGSHEDVAFALIMSSRAEEAMEILNHRYSKLIKHLGTKDNRILWLLAIRGILNARIGKVESAYYDFKASISFIIKKGTYASNPLTDRKLKVIIESYLDLMGKIKGSVLEKQLQINASNWAFKASNFLSDQKVQQAILASSTRMIIEDKELLELTRTEQDMNHQITAYQNIVMDMLTRPMTDRDLISLQKFKTTIDALSDARTLILADIKKRFPAYSNLINPNVFGFTDVQQLLNPHEVLVSIFSTENTLFIWAIPKNGNPEFVVVPIKRKDLSLKVSAVLCGVLPASGVFGQIPDFNFQQGYDLYRLLLQPIEAVLSRATAMILVSSEPVSRIPLFILPTEPFQLKKEEPFLSYLNAPWLIRKISISAVPSVSSFANLRSTPVRDSRRLAFAGFGDPYFNKTQMVEASRERDTTGVVTANQGLNLRVRGIRLTEAGSLDNQQILSCTIERLQRLPDTAEELLSISEMVGANAERDVFLGELASEKQVKTMNLSNRRVIAFASHALMPHDLDGLDQPAIALSSPSVTGHDDDGLLTMAEILDLKLNADWVVLSACNTGAAEGATAEAVSGLGRAFFYAGTRAVLVSMWAVETSSAKKLTTAIFRHQRDNPTLSRSHAHQKAMLELISNKGLSDGTSKTVDSYAHPFFWAPFIVVGDGG